MSGFEVYNVYVVDLIVFGIEVEIGVINYDGIMDILIVMDSVLFLIGRIDDFLLDDSDFDLFKCIDLIYVILFFSGWMKIIGLVVDGNVYMVDCWSYVDDLVFCVIGEVEGEVCLELDGWMVGILVIYYFFMMFQVLNEDLIWLVSCWLLFLMVMLQMFYIDIMIDSMVVMFEVYSLEDGGDFFVVFGMLQLDGYKLLNVIDGCVGEYFFDCVI